MKTVVLAVLALLLFPALLSAEDITGTDRGKLAYLIAHSVGGFDSYTPPGSATFPDVPTDATYYAEIEYVVDLGIMAGYADGQFHPEFLIARDQGAVYVARVIDVTDQDLAAWSPPETPTFSDVPQGFWAFKEVEYINYKGILADNVGASAEFEPKLVMDTYLLAHWLELATGIYVDPDLIGSVAEDITGTDRGKLAYLIAHSVGGFDSYEPPESPTFPDVPTGAAYYAEIEYVVGLGIMAGYPDGLFHPEFLIARDQGAVYVARVIDVTDQDLEAWLPPEEPTFSDVPQGYWAFKEVEYINYKGILADNVGTSAEFEPTLLMDIYLLAHWLELATGVYVDPGVIGSGTGTVAVVVADKATDAPLSLAELTLVEVAGAGTASDTTDAMGECSVPVPVGTYDITASCAGYYLGEKLGVEVREALTTPVELLLVQEFPDADEGSWAYSEIGACVSAGIVAGYGDGTYQPESAVTRDQMAVYIARALAGGDDNVPEFTGTPTFSDVPEGFWALDYVEYAVSQDVVGGYADGTYHPEYEVTRDQMPVYVARSKGWISIGDDMATAGELFSDVPAGHWAGTAIEACVTNDVVQGYGDGTYRPETVVTRDQMAVYVARAFGLTT